MGYRLKGKDAVTLRVHRHLHGASGREPERGRRELEHRHSAQPDWRREGDAGAIDGDDPQPVSGDESALGAPGERAVEARVSRPAQRRRLATRLGGRTRRQVPVALRHVRLPRCRDRRAMARFDPDGSYSCTPQSRAAGRRGTRASASGTARTRSASARAAQRYAGQRPRALVSAAWRMKTREPRPDLCSVHCVRQRATNTVNTTHGSVFST